MLDKVKMALRIKTSAFDEELEGIIAAAETDLRLIGIKTTNDEENTMTDPLIQRAIILYAKANFGFFEESEKYQKAYDNLRCALSLAGDYIEVE